MARLRRAEIQRGVSKMTSQPEPFHVLAHLAAEGARRYGDDPRSIQRFVDGEIARMPAMERERVLNALSMATEAPHRT